MAMTRGASRRGRRPATATRHAATGAGGAGQKSGRPRIRVLLADEHVLFRRGLANLLRAEPDVEVAGEASDGAEAIAQAAALRPDVILMEMRMPQVPGPEAARRILEIHPAAKIVMLTVSEDQGGVLEAVKNGAMGYLLKTIDPPALFAAVRGVLRGEAVLSSGVASMILLEFSRQAAHLEESPPPPGRLSRREQKSLALVAEGKSNRQIATVLGLAEGTVKNQLRHILAKLHLENRVQLAVFACNQNGGTPSNGAAHQGT